MRYYKKITALLLLLASTVSLLAGCGKKNAQPPLLSPSNPVSISIWNYYNGAQLTAFNELVDQFNRTRGKELGIIVTGYSQGSVNDLQVNVMNAVEGKVGAAEVPNIFAAYADTAYELDQMGVLVNLSACLTPDQKAEYIDSYLSEGDFSGNGAMKIFPTAKSTELFLLNETDWQAFADATGAKESDFATIEGLVDTAQRYYEWTDSLTEEPNDGKAFYGRDAMANYFLISGMQLGCEIFSIQDGKPVIRFEHDVIRKIWDAYYVPFVKGYFAASGRFRSDDIKTGNVLAYTGSSSGATFFPKMVATDDGEYPINMKVFPAPQFAGSRGYAVQQGAGMVVTQGTEAEIAASLEFLMWFTQPERNISFSIDSGYMPVTKAANNMDVIRKQAGEIAPVMDAVLAVAVDTVRNNTLYTTKAFRNGVTARNILETCLSDQASADRAAVLQAIAAGASMEEATAEYLTDDYFEAWYQRVLYNLNALEIS